MSALSLSVPGQMIASRPDGRMVRPLHRLFFGRPFRGSATHRLLILFEPNRISYASVYPFLSYADAFASRYDVQIRLLPVQRALVGGLPGGLANPTHVIAQTWLTDPPERHTALARLLERLPENIVTAYLDTFANVDIRLATKFTNVDYYFKKSLFVDSSRFLHRTYGHTNLSEYYGRLYGLPDELTDWNVPETVLPKLHVAPNFLTAPNLMTALLDGPETLPSGERDIDLHARLGGTGKEGWYGEMRRHAEKAVHAMTNLNTAAGTGIGHAAFMDELHRSKICFSPFGYGELCWRDIEAIAAGAALVKPDMSHLRTEPDLYREGETYLACRWDFADLEDKVRLLLSDEPGRRRIAHMARDIARRYLADAGPVSTYGTLFKTGNADMSKAVPHAGQAIG